jgi:unsaturated rhamnogalacturonyl hydrolase
MKLQFSKAGVRVAAYALTALALAVMPIGCGAPEDGSPLTGVGGGVVGVGGTGSGGAPTVGGTTAVGGSSSGGTIAAGGSVVPAGGAAAVGGSPAGGSGAGGAGAGGVGTGGAGTETGGTNGAGGSEPVEGPLDHLKPSAQQVGLLLAERFGNSTLSYTRVNNLPGDGYKSACEWYGSLGVANLTDTQPLVDKLVTKFDSFKANFVTDMTSGDKHVDRYIYGMVPLEIYIQTGDASYLPLGTQVADSQIATDQTRDAIDDMFMMTGLQIEAYRATQDAKYIDYMSDVMVDYLQRQKANGLFFHNDTEGPVHWGRGNGWFASGMAEMMRDLPSSHKNYAAILNGYKKMMDGLLQYQGDNGLWYQVIDQPTNPSNWEETSGSAMFTYAMIAGVKRGILDAATFVPVIDAAWAGIQTKIATNGDVKDICIGTWYKASAQEYMALTRLTGDGHGQAPVLWAAAEVLR